MKALTADIALGWPINGITDRHVVRGNCFCDRARRAAGAEKPTGNLLPRADFGKRAVTAGVQIDLQRFLIGIGFRVRHSGAAVCAGAGASASIKRELRSLKSGGTMFCFEHL